MRHGRHQGRLFWRVYLNGLLLLVLVAAALGAVGWAFGSRGPALRADRIAELAALQVAGDLGDPERLAADLRRAREAFDAEVAVYQGERLVAANVEPAPPPLPPGERARLAGGGFTISHRRWAFAAPVPGAPGAYVVLGHRWRPFSPERAAAVVLAVLLALAVASVPLARAIAAPLEKLTETARRLGAGDLSARAGIRGRGEVGELARTFDEMAERIEALVRAERELLASVSHELRTPIARIRVALDLAAEGDQERARRALAEIGTDLAELTELVEDVLTAARLERGGGLPLSRERFEPRTLLEQAAARFREDWPERTLELSVADGLPALDADPALLRRALENLLDNARKYSDAGQPVALSARAAAGAVEIEVRDRGIGVGPEDLPRLFTPFFRTDRSRARGTGGVGLGLALVKRIAEAHGGSASAQSAPGQGTAVRIRIPVAG